VIEELHIRGLGVIEDARITLAPGLTVVTGETGAGKTMIVTALGLLLGGRASSDLVRSGVDLAIVDAVVQRPSTRRRAQDSAVESVPSSARSGRGDDANGGGPSGSVEEDRWAESEDGVLFVSREIPAQGRSRGRIAGRTVPVSELTALLGRHVEVHGQHEHVRLERPAFQRELLDGYAGLEHAALLEANRSAHAAWRDLVRRHELLTRDAAARERRHDELSHELSEIDAAALDVERDAVIDHDIDRLANADALRATLDAAVAAAGADGALEQLGAALAVLRRAPGDDPTLGAIVSRLEELSREVSEAVADLAGYAADVEADDARLDALQVRKRELTVLMRRYGATIADVLAHRGSVASELAEMTALEADADGLDAAIRAARAELVSCAAAVTTSRRAAAMQLEVVVAGHLRELGLEHARLIVAVEPAPETDPAPHGADRIDLLLAANPGEPPARLADGASGGERSRVALALEVALAEVDDASVLVFDEVDAGIGGSTALAVGEKLASLAHAGARPRQVLCVTHLAQVAAFADEHHVVEKVLRDGRTVTTARRIAEEDRVAELSRMLGGEATADAGLEHARGLLAAAMARRGGGVTRA